MDVGHRFARVQLIGALSFGLIAVLGGTTAGVEDQPVFDSPLQSDALWHEAEQSSTAAAAIAPISSTLFPGAPLPQTTAAAPRPTAPPVFPGPKTLPPTGPWKVLFFENDFSYLADPNHERLFGESFKNVEFEVGDESLTISSGGEIRHRYINEDNRLRPGGPLHADNQLWRWRHYIDGRLGRFRLYFEGIEADSFGTDAPDLPIDVNQWDIQNLFVDINLFENDWGAHILRYGRQELLFGRQRLVSPLDWANIRRNFEGARYFVKRDDYRLDLFAVHPVNTATGFGNIAHNDNQFDSPVDHVWFSGAYFTYSGWKNTNFDLYWLFLDTGERDVVRPDGKRHLYGSRYARLFPVTTSGGTEVRVWDFDTEGGIQVGRDNDADVLAGFYTCVLGHTWKTVPLTPRVAGLFYYGSGDQTPDAGHNNTFNTLFPLAHAYWALSDNLTGQNLYDWELRADVKPTKKTALTTAYHWFALASNGDRLYNVAGVPFGAPGNGRDVGQACDVYGYYSHNANFDIQAGYSWFWYGEFIQRTTPRGDASQFYVQTSFRY